MPSTKSKRTKKPSNAVVKSAVYASPPLAVLMGWATAAIHAKNPAIPLEVIGAGLSTVVSTLTGAVAWLAKGGRKGEAD